MSNSLYQASPRTECIVRSFTIIFLSAEIIPAGTVNLEKSKMFYFEQFLIQKQTFRFFYYPANKLICKYNSKF